MVVNNIFGNVQYPNDRKSIEHIIKEYDRKLNHKLESPVFKKINIFYIYLALVF